MDSQETLAEYISSQDNLVQEAAEALPHQFSQCTYPLGPLRQAVYLCLTCPESRGICPACSIACHTDHEQIELFPKRNFRCDCPTEAIAHPCSLHTVSEPVNESNRYDQNFQALFCRCKRTYDAKTEKETMIQCLACEDWFHESCCNLRDRPTEDPCPKSQDQGEQPSGDATSEASTDLPPPLISAEDYDAFVCRDCVLKIPILQNYAGTAGCWMVVRKEIEMPWKILQGLADAHEEDLVDIAEPSTVSNGIKRPLSSSSLDNPSTKKPRLSESSDPSLCLAPSPKVTVKSIFSHLSSATDPALSLGAGDLFFTEGFRDRWCRCVSCLPELESHPYLLIEEETYEPPEDPDSALSLEELGMRALSRIPRDRAIEGIHAFNALKAISRDDLLKFLRPFAQEGKVVNDEDVKSFFDGRMEEQRAFREREG